MENIDPVEVSPDNYKVLLENEHVRVLEMQLGAGKSDNKHSHPDLTAYVVKGGKIRMHEDSGPKDMDVPDGAALWIAAHTHRVENIGTTDFKVIVIEDKKSK